MNSFFLFYSVCLFVVVVVVVVVFILKKPLPIVQGRGKFDLKILPRGWRFCCDLIRVFVWGGGGFIRPFYSCVLRELAFEWQRGWR